MKTKSRKLQNYTEGLFLRKKIKVKTHHVFHYQALITGHFLTKRTYFNNTGTYNVLEETFQQNLILTFRRNRNVRDIIDGNKIDFNKVKRKSLTVAKGKCTPCKSNKRTLCCRQIIKTTTLQSNQNKRTYTIYHNVNCKSKYTIYLMECNKCKLQHVGKAETSFMSKNKQTS